MLHNAMYLSSYIIHIYMWIRYLMKMYTVTIWFNEQSFSCIINKFWKQVDGRGIRKYERILLYEYYAYIQGIGVLYNIPKPIESLG